MKSTRCIVDYVRQNKEFDYIKKVSDYYKADYNHLCDFTLDFYNYQRRNGLDKTGAKIMSLQNMIDYAYNNYLIDLKVNKDGR